MKQLNMLGKRFGQPLNSQIAKADRNRTESDAGRGVTLTFTGKLWCVWRDTVWDDTLN